MDGGSGRRGKGSGGVQGLRFGGVSGRGTGPRDGANFVLSFLIRTKRRKMFFLRAGLVNGGVDQGP